MLAPTRTAPDVTPAPSGLLSGVHGPVDRFCLENDPASVAALLARFHDRLRAVGVCGEQASARVVIALEEALLNAVYHGNLELSSDLKESGDGRFEALARERRGQAPYAARRVRVAAGIGPARATFVIQDEGPGFDVSKIPDPTAPEFLERPSGRGLLLMRAFMDDVRYNATGTRCTLVKNAERGMRNEASESGTPLSSFRIPHSELRLIRVCERQRGCARRW